MLLYSFGSDFNLEDTSKENLSKLRSDVAYANQRGIEVGGYDLIALTRRVRDEWAALGPDGNVTGNACFASGWRDHLLQTVRRTTDGSFFIVFRVAWFDPRFVFFFLF